MNPFHLAKKDTVVVITGRRFLAMIAAFVLLAVVLAFSMDKIYTNAHDGRKNLQQAVQTNLHNLKAATYNTLIQGCKSGNDLRVTLQHIILNPESIAQAKQLVKQGRFTQADLNKSIEIAKKEQKTVAPRDCNKAYLSLKP